MKNDDNVPVVISFHWSPTIQSILFPCLHLFLWICVQSVIFICQMVKGKKLISLGWYRVGNDVPVCRDPNVAANIALYITTSYPISTSNLLTPSLVSHPKCSHYQWQQQDSECPSWLTREAFLTVRTSKCTLMDKLKNLGRFPIHIMLIFHCIFSLHTEYCVLSYTTYARCVPLVRGSIGTSS